MARSSNKAFTLIELLVVISVIALLVAILLPALSRARISAQEMQCKSSLRQLVIAATSSATDSAGQFPTRGDHLNNQTFPYWASHGAWHPLGRGQYADSRFIWDDYLDDYTGETGSRSIYCPLMPEGVGLTYEEAWPNAQGNHTWGYAYLAHAIDDWRWQGSESPPENLEAPSDQSIWTDITIGVIGQRWLLVPHTVSGKGWYSGGPTVPEASSNTPQGTHAGRVDGSVALEVYVPGTTVNSQPDVEYSVRHGGNPGILQGRAD